MFTPGQSVLWWMESRRGYCPAWWVPATVVKVGRKRVTIDAQLARGGTKRVSVQPERLKAKVQS